MSSLKERAAARRRQLEEDKSFVVPLIGYEDMFAVRYRALPLEDQMKIGERNAELKKAEQAVANAADTIINSCIEFLEVKGKDEYVSLGCKWTADTARELFGAELPEGASARDAVSAVFSGPLGTTRLVVHADACDSETIKALSAVDEVISGESEPSVEG